MPLVKIYTNQKINEEELHGLLVELTHLLSAWLNKPSHFVQIIIETDVKMAFAGTFEPTLFGEIRTLGLTEEKIRLVTATLTDWFKKKLSIRSDRIFLNFFDLQRTQWGWNGTTFG